MPSRERCADCYHYRSYRCPLPPPYWALEGRCAAFKRKAQVWQVTGRPWQLTKEARHE